MLRRVKDFSPMNDVRTVPVLVLAASAAILAAAFAFQYLGGLAPCVLCLWQRFPHGIVIALAAVAFALNSHRWTAALMALCGIVLVAGAGIAFYHVGVEQHWWQGTAACGSALTPAATIDELRERLLAQPVVRCDEISWSLFGVSMAGYNFMLSAALATFALTAAWRLWRTT